VDPLYSGRRHRSRAAADRRGHGARPEAGSSSGGHFKTALRAVKGNSRRQLGWRAGAAQDGTDTATGGAGVAPKIPDADIASSSSAKSSASAGDRAGDKAGDPPGGARNRERAGNARAGEIGGPAGPEPTRYGDWEVGGRCTDF